MTVQALAVVARPAAHHAGHEGRAGGDSDQRVQRVPGAVDERDLVGQEFNERQQAGGKGHHQRRGQHLQARRQCAIQPQMPGDADEQHGQVKAQATGPAEGGGQGDELDGVELHQRTLARPCRSSTAPNSASMTAPVMAPSSGPAAFSSGDGAASRRPSTSPAVASARPQDQ